MKYLLFSLFLLFTTTTLTAQDVDVELFKGGFSQPLDLQNAGDQRLFVVEKGGKIKIIQADGTVNPIPFLDISSQISTGNEQGLLGLAFHPDYTANGYFFINYTTTNGDTRVSRFSVDSTNPDIADPLSETTIIEYQQPYVNHNGGCLAFGGDGNLFIASGDGGGSGDPDNRGQNINTLLGKILRLDVDNPSGGKNYGIPSDNPFVGQQNAREEIWAYGLRNPWRFSFDPVTDNLWIADVGQADIEEINRQPANLGGVNYGWRCYEGSQPFNTQGCPAQSELTFPVAHYTHDNGNCSISGGYVYRGSTYSDIEGLYFFADFCSGLIGTVDENDSVILHGNFSGMWTGFGQDVNKELYIIDMNGGNIFSIKGGQVAGIADEAFQKNISLWPNPVKEKIFISHKNLDLQQVEIFDVLGRSVFQEFNVKQMKMEIAVSQWSRGLYTVKITDTSGRTAVRKVVVQ